MQRLRAHFVWSPVHRWREPAVAEAPFIVHRSQWGADENLVRAPPRFARYLRFAVIHHTAGKPAESPEESAAILRGIQLFHVQANGWDDIGYNFLVDGFGQVFEGRAGGADQNVIGAHARELNIGSVGLAVLGHYHSRDRP